MYYISANTPNGLGLARKCKRLSDFTRTDLNAVEGSEWMVRTRAKIKPLDSIDVYRVENGKLCKTDVSNLIF